MGDDGMSGEKEEAAKGLRRMLLPMVGFVAGAVLTGLVIWGVEMWANTGATTGLRTRHVGLAAVSFLWAGAILGICLRQFERLSEGLGKALLRVVVVVLILAMVVSACFVGSEIVG